MAYAEWMDSLNAMGARVAASFSFIGNRVSQYPALSIGEMIAYPCVGVGLVLIIVALFMIIM